MPQNFYELVCIFIIYAFIGWCTEVAYATVNTGKFVNRGFLNGPYCPIYGCGVVLVVACLTPIKDNLFILFLGSVGLTTAIEFITGFVLEKVFHNKWWDYSDVPFNVKGYICLKFSIYWGIACTFVMSVVHPIIYTFITVIPFPLGVTLVTIIMVVFTVDICLTVAAIKKLNEKIKVMDEIALQIHKVSDMIGENIHEGVSGAIEMSDEFQKAHPEMIEKATNLKEEIKDFPENTKEKMEKEYQELTAKYQELMEKGSLGTKRLMKAFPKMKPATKNISRHEIFEKYKEVVLNKKNK